MIKIRFAGETGTVPNYVQALRLAGAEPVDSLTPGHLEEFDGLLLPGGPDIDPARYGQENTASVLADAYLEERQFALLDAFVRMKKPILGICRGHQLLHVYFGGTLIQDLSCAERHRAIDHVDQVHPTEALADSFLGKLYGTAFSTNSSHHQGVDRPGTDLKVVQWSEQHTVVEASEHCHLPIWSVQWHPERMCGSFARTDTVDGKLIFDFFLRQCK